MPESDKRREESDIQGFWEKSGLEYLLNMFRAVERGNLAIEYLVSRWADLMGDERRVKYREAEGAFDTAEASARAITDWKGLTPKLDAKLKAAKERRDADGTKAAKIEWLRERGKIYNSVLMESGVVLSPQTNPADIVSSFLENLISVSEPVYTDKEEDELTDDQLSELIAERLSRIIGEDIEEPEETLAELTIEENTDEPEDPEGDEDAAG